METGEKMSGNSNENSNANAIEDKEESVIKEIVENTDSTEKIYTSQQKLKDDQEKSEEEQAKAKFNLFTTVDRFGDLFYLNLLFILTSIPIITIGASVTAMYAVTLKMVKNEEGPVSKEYFKAFKQNFKQSTICWIILVIIGTIIYFEYGTMLAAENSRLGDVLMVMIGLEFIILTFILPLLFPLISRYENTTGKMFINSFVLSFTNLGTWFAIVISWAIPIALMALIPNLFAYTWYLWILILTSTIAYANAHTIWKLFDKLDSRGGKLTGN